MFCNSWGRKELDMTEQLNWTELNIIKEEILLHFYHKYLDKNIEFKKNKNLIAYKQWLFKNNT